MSAELIYRTTTPSALELWDAYEIRYKAQGERRRAFEDEMTELYGPPDLPDYYEEARRSRRGLWLRGDHAFAIESGWREKPPADSGWRLDSKDKNWQPALRNAAGKKLAERLAELSRVNREELLAPLGVASLAFADHRLYRPGLELDKDERAIYQTWGSGRVKAEVLANHAKAPEIIWEKIKRSEFYAREERLGRGTDGGE